MELYERGEPMLVGRGCLSRRRRLRPRDERRKTLSVRRSPFQATPAQFHAELAAPTPLRLLADRSPSTSPQPQRRLRGVILTMSGTPRPVTPLPSIDHRVRVDAGPESKHGGTLRRRWSKSVTRCSSPIAGAHNATVGWHFQHSKVVSGQNNHKI